MKHLHKLPVPGMETDIPIRVEVNGKWRTVGSLAVCEPCFNTLWRAFGSQEP